LLFGTIFTPDDPLLAVHIGNQAKKRAVDNSEWGKKSGPVTQWRSPFGTNMPVASDQRPKNSHNRIMTGIGTPSSQSRIPRPILASMKSS
jgi:hypothetical protein